MGSQELGLLHARRTPARDRHFFRHRLSPGPEGVRRGATVAEIVAVVGVIGFGEHLSAALAVAGAALIARG